MYVKDHIDKEFTIMRWDGFGYPVVGYPSFQVNRKAGLGNFDYTLSVTVPEDLVAANGGKLSGKSTIDGQITYTYTNLKPAWRMDMPIAPYGILEDKQNLDRLYQEWIYGTDSSRLIPDKIPVEEIIQRYLQ